jgi:exopolysaccharide biosynthesis protein
MKRNVLLVAFLGFVLMFTAIGMLPWIIEGPKRLLKGQWQRFHKTQAEKA